MPRDVYLLPRGGLASARLTFQHAAVTRAQGWLLHPNVRQSISNLKTPRIADLATGNGIWAFEVAEEFPSAEIVGLDISAEQFPPTKTWPSNVKFELGDLFEPVPARYQQYFDVVHIRLIVAAIYNMDKDILMQNIVSMIKPGGYIQWDEIIEPTGITYDKDLNMKYEMANCFKRMFKVANFRPATQWADTLPNVYMRYGLENIVGHKPVLKPSTLPQQTESLAWSLRECMGMAVKMGKPNAEEELRLAEQDMEELAASGHMWAYAWIVAIGKKPLEH